ncbi:MAG TPA: hypothetical protein VL961_10960 [Acidimicrobiales bacterium]|nr:hypothetical protein [Acidimicrobiales bacterium]
MRRGATGLAGLGLFLGLVASATSPAAARTDVAVHDVAGAGAAGSLSAPSGIALDQAGDLFVADTDHCRVVVVPSRAGHLYGTDVRAHHAYVVAGSPCGTRGSLPDPTGVAVGSTGDLYIAEASADRVVMVGPGGLRRGQAPRTVAGTGSPGYSGNGLVAHASALDEPTGIALDAAGDLFIADTANCRVRMVPATSGVHYGQSMQAGHLYDLVGNGTCGSADGSPGPSSEIWDPVAVAVDSGGNVVVADQGDQTVVELAARTGTYYGTSIDAGDAQVVIGQPGDGNTPYLQDGLSATSIVSELNDPEGLAVAPDGTLFVTDGSMHCIRVVPAVTGDVLGRTMAGGDYYTLAGALPVNNAQGVGDGTRWIVTHMDVPFGIAVAPSGAVVFSDNGANQVRELG